MDRNSRKTKTRAKNPEITDSFGFVGVRKDQFLKWITNLIDTKIQTALDQHLIEYEHKESGLTPDELEFLKSHNSRDYEIEHGIIHKRSAS